MDAGFKSALEDTPGLFYVTSKTFLNAQGAGFEETFKDILAGRHHVIPDAQPDVLHAAEKVRVKLRQAPGIRGVVILGDYTQVPSHAIMSIDPALYARMETEGVKPGDDPDRWWVWNDDIYGCVDGAFDLPDLPVSRLPAIPTTMGTPYGPAAEPTIYGVRSSDFPVARYVYEQLAATRVAGPAAAPMDESPPAAADAVSAGVEVGASDLGSDLVYLVLHGVANRFEFKGGSGNHPIAVSDLNIGGVRTRPAVVFGGICWGALVVNHQAMVFRKWPDRVLEAHKVEDSAPLTFVDKGVNAFVGFTALHQLPDVDSSEAVDTFGAPMHKYFWENIVVEKMAPAGALFHAKAKAVMSLDPENTDLLELSKTLKAVWSATCIGFGW